MIVMVVIMVVVVARPEGLEFYGQRSVLPPEFEFGHLVGAALSDTENSHHGILAFVPVEVIVGRDGRRRLGMGMDRADIFQPARGDDAVDLCVIGDDVVVGRLDDARDGDLLNFKGLVLEPFSEQDGIDFPGVAAAGSFFEFAQVGFVD